MAFQKATRKMAKLRLGLTGPSGAGKTLAALMIAQGLGGRTAIIDTEEKSSTLYADEFDFDIEVLRPPFTPEAYIAKIHEAEEAGYDNLIIDSTTHEWNGKGGVLELLDNVAKKFKGNTYMAWGELTPRHAAFIQAILQSRCHVIVTMRSKQDYVLTERNGKQVPQKVGMAPIQRDGFEYELTTVLDIHLDGHVAVASKDRTRLFADPHVITADTGRRLLDWLNKGEADTAPTPPPRHTGTYNPPAAPEPAARRTRNSQREEPPMDDNPPPADEADQAGGDQQAPGAMPAGELQNREFALESCETAEELRKEWEDAKRHCQRLGDTAAYAKLKKAMEAAAEAIRQHATA